jgi:hypothetical protein
MTFFTVPMLFIKKAGAKKKRLFGLLLLFIIFLATATGGLFVNTAHAAGYQYYVPITVTSDTSVASGTQTSFPMLVSSTLSQWIYPGHHISNATSTFLLGTSSDVGCIGMVDQVNSSTYYYQF